jgi:hypothetical protein
MTDSPPPEERQTRPFADVLTSLRRGKTHREASDLMQQLVTAVRDTHRGGTMVITLKVGRHKSGRIEIDDTVKIKLPEPERDASIYFADEDGNLSKDDPQQQEIPGIVRVVNPNEGRATQ